MLWAFDTALAPDLPGPAMLQRLLHEAGLDARATEEATEAAGRRLVEAARRCDGAAEIDFEAVIAGRQGTLWMQARIDPMAGRPPGACRWRGLFRDVTDRRTAERYERLVRREMTHRAKNLFAVVAALLTISARDMPEAQAYAEDMRRRITALAAAYRYLEEDEEGAARPLGLGGLLREVLMPYGDGIRAVLTDSVETLPTGPRAATGVALMLHELATNAAKHGALARAGGLVRLHAWRSGPTLRLRWAEAGGPLVEGPPEGQGFGTRLLDRIAGQLLGATVGRRWLPGGLQIDLSIPAARLAG